MTFRDFPAFDESSAPAAARAALTATRQRFGAVPAPVARYASSPALLLTALAGLDSFEKTTLTPLEREVLAMTMGRRNGCHFCLQLHTRLLSSLAADAKLVRALQNGDPLSDARLEALRCFVLALVEHSGDVPRAEWQRFREAGYTHEQALELVLGVGVYTMTTLANRLTETSE
ncbi:MAG: carboxymuconolactone decarboxylase family protein [Myxococcales bacterium]|nr:MAG: carboxymuconolactone decarboxylase family protein [Myxococcales bacterium]